jgi:hypothetical protein
MQEQVEFYAKCLNPDAKRLVAGKDLNRNLNILFGGQFQDARLAMGTGESDSEEDPEPSKGEKGDTATRRKEANAAQTSSGQKTEPSDQWTEALKSQLVKGTKGYATDIKRILINAGCVNPDGTFDSEIFKTKLLSKEISLDLFQGALS